MKFSKQFIKAGFIGNVLYRRDFCSSSVRDVRIQQYLNRADQTKSITGYDWFMVIICNQGNINAISAQQLFSFLHNPGKKGLITPFALAFTLAMASANKAWEYAKSLKIKDSRVVRMNNKPGAGNK